MFSCIANESIPAVTAVMVESISLIDNCCCALTFIRESRCASASSLFLPESHEVNRNILTVIAKTADVPIVFFRFFIFVCLLNLKVIIRLIAQRYIKSGQITLFITYYSHITDYFQRKQRFVNNSMVFLFLKKRGLRIIKCW